LFFVFAAFCGGQKRKRNYFSFPFVFNVVVVCLSSLSQSLFSAFFDRRLSAVVENTLSESPMRNKSLHLIALKSRQNLPESITKKTRRGVKKKVC